MTTVNIDVGKLVGATIKSATKGIQKAIPVLTEELKRLTPEDTWEMLNSYVSDIDYRWNNVIWSVWNTAKHAIYVEYGQSGRNFVYQKPKGNRWRYVWQWVRTFARSADNKREEIANIIYQEVNKWLQQ